MLENIWLCWLERLENQDVNEDNNSTRARCQVLEFETSVLSDNGNENFILDNFIFILHGNKLDTDNKLVYLPILQPSLFIPFQSCSLANEKFFTLTKD